MRLGVRTLSAFVKRGLPNGQKIAARFRAGAFALPHSAISATERPQPVQTLALVSSAQVSLQVESSRSMTILTSSLPIPPANLLEGAYEE